MGCASAYYLAKEGLQVVVLEKNAAVGLEASGRCACGVRQQGRTGALQLARASVHLWADLAEELEYDLEYNRVGNLKIVWDQEGAAELERTAAWEHSQGLTEVRLLSAAECREMVPGITERTVAGKFCPTDGIANPMLVTPAFGRAAARLGVKIHTSTNVTGLLKQGSTVRGVTTDTGEIEAGCVINTAGPWASRFNQVAGCHTPIQPSLDTLMITERQSRRFAPFVGFGWWGYILQPKAGNIVIGLEDKTNDEFDTRVEFKELIARAREMIQVLPWLRDVNFLRAFSGITEITPDREPYIGALPGITGFYTASGFSGQGFCLGPIVGKIMAELVTGRESSVSLSSFTPERFART
jgi:sarcosine oxidase subunit beta